MKKVISIIIVPAIAGFCWLLTKPYSAVDVHNVLQLRMFVYLTIIGLLVISKQNVYQLFAGTFCFCCALLSLYVFLPESWVVNLPFLSNQLLCIGFMFIASSIITLFISTKIA